MNSMKQSGRNTTTSKTGPVSLENGSRAAESKWVVPITYAVPMVMDSKFTQANSKINSVGLNLHYVPLVTLWLTLKSQ